MSRPHTLFGGAMIGTSFTTPEQVQALLDLLKTLGVDRIDTAARYSPTAPGSSECLLGETRAAEQGFTIDTKINTVSGVRAGTLTAAAIEKSLEASLSRLQMSKVNILHFHRPDPQTPIVKQAAEIHRQYLAGRFDKFGLSNFPPELVATFISVCEEKGYVKPTVYQGLYNLLSRESEEALLPLLRKHNIAFTAYSPLAGGFLTGRATRGDAEGTRYRQSSQFANNPLIAKYKTPEMHAAMADLLGTLEPLGIAGSEACLRWLYYHSALSEDDGVILGASKTPQIVQNMTDISKGPLPTEVLQKIDSLWEKVV